MIEFVSNLHIAFQIIIGVWISFGIMLFLSLSGEHFDNVARKKRYKEKYKSSLYMGIIIGGPSFLILSLIFGPIGAVPYFCDNDFHNPFKYINKEHLTVLVYFSPVLSLLLLWLI